MRRNALRIADLVARRIPLTAGTITSVILTLSMLVMATHGCPAIRISLCTGLTHLQQWIVMRIMNIRFCTSKEWSVNILLLYRIKLTYGARQSCMSQVMRSKLRM